MARLVPLPSREVIRRLRAIGYEGPEHGKSHMKMAHPARRRKIPVPRTNKDIGVGLIRTIIREAGITPEERNAL